MDYNSRKKPFRQILYKPKMILSLGFIIFYYKINFEKL